MDGENLAMRPALSMSRLGAKAEEAACWLSVLETKTVAPLQAPRHPLAPRRHPTGRNDAPITQRQHVPRAGAVARFAMAAGVAMMDVLAEMLLSARAAERTCSHQYEKTPHRQ